MSKEDFLLSDREINSIYYTGATHGDERDREKLVTIIKKQLDKLPNIWELLDKVKEDCRKCGGDGRGIPTLAEPDGHEEGCLTCYGKGYTYDLDRLCVLSKDQNLPEVVTKDYPLPNIVEIRKAYKKDNWKKAE